MFLRHDKLSEEYLGVAGSSRYQDSALKSGLREPLGVKESPCDDQPGAQENEPTDIAAADDRRRNDRYQHINDRRDQGCQNLMP